MAILRQGVVERLIQRHRASLLPRLGERFLAERGAEPGDVRRGIGPPDLERVEAHGLAEHACARVERAARRGRPCAAASLANISRLPASPKPVTSLTVDRDALRRALLAPSPRLALSSATSARFESE